MEEWAVSVATAVSDWFMGEFGILLFVCCVAVALAACYALHRHLGLHALPRVTLLSVYVFLIFLVLNVGVVTGAFIVYHKWSTWNARSKPPACKNVIHGANDLSIWALDDDEAFPPAVVDSNAMRTIQSELCESRNKKSRVIRLASRASSDGIPHLDRVGSWWNARGGQSLALTLAGFDVVEEWNKAHVQLDALGATRMHVDYKLPRGTKLISADDLRDLMERVDSIHAPSLILLLQIPSARQIHCAIGGGGGGGYSRYDAVPPQIGEWVDVLKTMGHLSANRAPILLWCSDHVFHLAQTLMHAPEECRSASSFQLWSSVCASRSEYGTGNDHRHQHHHHPFRRVAIHPTPNDYQMIFPDSDSVFNTVDVSEWLWNQTQGESVWLSMPRKNSIFHRIESMDFSKDDDNIKSLAKLWFAEASQSLADHVEMMVFEDVIDVDFLNKFASYDPPRMVMLKALDRERIVVERLLEEGVLQQVIKRSEDSSNSATVAVTNPWSVHVANPLCAHAMHLLSQKHRGDL
jgi:hypothetical protein